MDPARILSMLVLCSAAAFGQISHNTWLFGTLDPEPIHYAGCWGYTAADGSEFALIGAFTGTSIISIDDSSAIAEVGFISGPESNWREMTVIGDYAYISSEGQGPQAGMQVIYLGDLPESATLVTTYTTTFTTAHILQRDIFSDDPIVYVMGTSTGGGVHILDVSEPEDPQQVGTYAPTYIHDAHIRGDRLYASAVFDGFTDVVDISDRTDPQFLARIDHPQNLDHSSFTSADGNYLVITHEQDGQTAKIWDIQDLEDIELVAEYSANLLSLVHNPYGLADLMIFSHNTEGLRIVDLGDPELPVEVGFYDTYGGFSGGFNGLWSAYPWFPSGKMIGGNRDDGLYVIRFNDTRAARVYGMVIDSLSMTPLAGAQITLFEDGGATESDEEGLFRLGTLPGAYSLEVIAVGYEPAIIDDFVLEGGDSIALTIEMNHPTGIVSGAGLPGEFALYANYPNPFNPSTNVAFRVGLPAGLPVGQAVNAEWVTLEILEISGRHVKTIVDRHLSAGSHTARWDGTNSAGALVASGVYLYRMRAGEFSQTRRMLLIR